MRTSQLERVSYMWPLTRKWNENSARRRIQCTAEWLPKNFERLKSNGWTAKGRFWTDEPNGWRLKILNGWGRTAEWLKENFERMRSNCWTASRWFALNILDSIWRLKLSEIIRIKTLILKAQFVKKFTWIDIRWQKMWKRDIAFCDDLDNIYANL